MSMNCFKKQWEMILSEIRTAMEGVDTEQVEVFIKAILKAEQVFVVGVGRVMLSMQAMAKRFNHLGIKTFCVGDINEPAITKHDLLIIGSGSGESVVPVSIAKVAKRHGAKIAHIGSNRNSSLAPMTDVFVRIPVKTKLDLPDEIQSRQIMSSLFEQSLYVLADSAALLIADRRGLDIESLSKYHANLE